MKNIKMTSIILIVITIISFVALTTTLLGDLDLVKVKIYGILLSVGLVGSLVLSLIAKYKKL